MSNDARRQTNEREKRNEIEQYSRIIELDYAHTMKTSSSTDLSFVYYLVYNLRNNIFDLWYTRHDPEQLEGERKERERNVQWTRLSRAKRLF